MARRRGSIAFLMNSLSSGSSSSRSVCGLGTFTNSINSSLARSRDSLASRSFLISVSCIDMSSGVFGAADTDTLFHARQYDERHADREDQSRERPQDEHRVIVVRYLQCLLERPFRKLAEDQPDHQADQRIAVSSGEVT